MLQDFGLLTLRLTLGGLLAGHGAQKLFGLFEGYGIKGTGGFFESSLGLVPGETFAYAAGLSETGGGLLTALGLFNPIGPIATLGPMIVAWGRAHWGKPIWGTAGGAEQPLTYIAIAAALVALGPGTLSLDRVLGIRMPAWMAMLTGAGVAGGAYLTLSQPRPESPPADPAA